MGLKRTGVQLVAEGSDKFYKDLQRANNEIKSIGPSAGQATSGLSLANAVMIGFAATLGNVAFNAARNFIGQIKGIATEAVMSSARVDEMNQVVYLLGSRAGKTSGEMDTLISKVRDYGIRTDIAQNLIQQFTRYELDLAKAADLARVAQDTGVLAMKDSSEELQHILYGIQTYNTEVLRTAGLNINLQESFKKYADEVGKSTESLNANDKMQAALNAVLLEGTRNAGIYEASMESAGKQLRSLTGREIPELIRALGDPFQQAFLNIVSGARSIASSFREALEAPKDLAQEFGRSSEFIRKNFEQTESAAGSLRAQLMRVGAVFAVFTEGLRKSGENLAPTIIQTLAGGAKSFLDFAEKAFGWGFNTIAQFAQGIIEGAASVLTAAMNWISSLLESWLGPGSPPKVALNIDKWGLKAMTEFLKGMTQADFGALKGIQGPLNQALQLMVRAGGVSARQSADIYKSISAQIAKALATGVGDENIFSRIQKTAGPYGNEIAELAKRQLALARATNAVKAAEKALEDARKRQFAANKKTNSLVKEYNALVKSGAGRDVLAAKMAQIRASEAEEQAASDAATQAEEDLRTRSEGLDQLQEQVQLQQELVSQLLDMGQMDLAAQLADAAKGAGGALEDLTSKVGGIGGTITKTLDQAFENLKNSVREKWGEMLAPLRERWDLEVQPKLDNLQSAWDRFTLAVKTAWETNAQPTVDALKEIIPSDWAAKIGIAAGIIIVLGGAFLILAAAVSAVVGFVFSLPGAIILLVATVAVFGEQAKKTLEMLNFLFWYYLWLALKSVYEFVQGIVDYFKGLWQDLVGGSVIPEMMQAILTSVSEFLTLIYEKWLEIWGSLVTWFATNFQAPITEKLEALKSLWNEIWGGIVTFMEENVKKPLLQFYQDVVQKFLDGFQSLKDKIEDLKTKFTELWESIKSGTLPAWFWALIGQSPSPLAIGTKYAAQELRKYTQQVKDLEKATSGVSLGSVTMGMPGAYVMAGAQQEVNDNRAVNMGGVTLANGWDETIFEARMRRILTEPHR